MNKLLIILGLLLSSCSITKKPNFEGFVKFSTHISTTKAAPEKLQEQLNDKYGDSLIMYYSSNGHFRRIHLNSANYGADSQFYFPKESKLYFTYKNSNQIDSLNVSKNSLQLISEGKINKQQIMGLDCECYEYKAITDKTQKVVLNYCYHTSTPEINPQFYADHNDFFLNSYYKFAKRPYLKFSIETEQFKIIYLASELDEKRVRNDIFELN